MEHRGFFCWPNKFIVHIGYTLHESRVQDKYSKPASCSVEISAPQAAVTAASNCNCKYMCLKTYLTIRKKKNLPVWQNPQAPLAFFGSYNSKKSVEI